MILIILLSLAVVMDLTDYKISNSFLLFFALIGLFYNLFLNPISKMFSICVSLSILFLLLFPLFICSVIGAADVKLLLIMCFYFSLKQMMLCVVISFFIAAIQSVILLGYQYLRKHQNKKIKIIQGKADKDTRIRTKHQIHFSISILASVLIIRGGSSGGG